MSTVTVRRRLANPAQAKRTRRRNMSPKQIKFFGTAQQKAALKRKRKNAAAAPRRRHKSIRRKNAGEIVIAGLAGLNPAPAMKRRTTMKKQAAKKKTRSRKSSVVVVRTNPAPQRRRRVRRNPTKPKTHHRSRRRNPSIGGGASDLLTSGSYVLGGLLGPRFLTQAALGSKNTGVMGYFGNALATGLLYLAAKYGLKNKNGANLVVAGGAASIILRAVQDFSPLGAAVNSQLQGVGDLAAYSATTFFAPLQEAPGPQRGNQMLPGAVDRPAPTPIPASGIAAVGRGRLARSRYA